MGSLFSEPTRVVWLVPLLPLLGFLINGFFGKKLSLASSGAIASGAVVCSFLVAVSLFTGTLGDVEQFQSVGFSWIATAGLSVDFRLQVDHLSGLFMLVITGIGSLIHIYSVGYMSHDRAYARYFAYLNLFCFAMLMLVMGNSLLTMFLGWEGVGLCSYLLIGFWYDHNANCNAGKKAFIVNRVGDFGFLIGLFLILYHFGTLGYSGLAEGIAQAHAQGAVDTSLLNWACLCLFIGAAGKSAQIPLYVWLPDAMAGPTPVSALIHAATMVTSGIYMIARLNFLWVHAETALAVVAVVGSVTALFAGTVGLVQRDIKKVLAYSTVSQLGFMFMALGLGNFPVAVFHVFTHAFFKALLFLGAGSVIHSLEHTLGHGHKDSQDLFKMGGLKSKMPLTCATMMVGAAGLAGIPLFSGFFSKDAILYAAFHRGDALGWFVWLMGVAAAACTSFYSFRLIALAFFGKWRGEERVYAHADEGPRSMGFPLLILALFAFGAGYLWLPAAFGLHIEPFHRFLWPIWESGQAMLAEGSPLRFAAPAAEHDAHALAMEWVNMAISSAIAVGVSAFAFTIYSKPAQIEKLAAMVSGEKAGLGAAWRTLLNKYYVDELYDRSIVRPLKILAEFLFLLVDQILIELLLVTGSAVLVEATSKLGKRIQTGVVRHYLYAFAVGAVVLIALFLIAV